MSVTRPAALACNIILPMADRDAKTVGCHLHQVMIVRAAAYDMQLLYGEGSQLMQVPYYLTVTEDKALKDATRYLSVGFRHGLVGLTAIVLNGLYHTLGIGKAGIVGIAAATKTATLAAVGLAKAFQRYDRKNTLFYTVTQNICH